VGDNVALTVSRPAHQSSPSELQEQIVAERAGTAFLVFRDADAAQRIVALDSARGTCSIGRGSSADVRLAWDREVSRVHAELEYVGGNWTISDNGLSRNGTFVNGDRVKGRRRLFDNDEILSGATRMLFRCPPGAVADDVIGTHTSAGAPEAPALSDAQRRVAAVLCRGFGSDGTFGEPATNEEIASELFLSVATVKTHLRVLYQRYNLEDVPQNVKRRRLVALLVQTGVVEPE
jgi:pSer/pThr/pTyr-binding forkhead associated (FHA) protein